MGVASGLMCFGSSTNDSYSDYYTIVSLNNINHYLRVVMSCFFNRLFINKSFLL